jgi:hypothetical protein
MRDGDDFRELRVFSLTDKCPEDDAEEFDLATLSGNDDGLSPCDIATSELPCVTSVDAPGIGIGEEGLLSPFLSLPFLSSTAARTSA